jgi:nucleotide-binding universal stress UspA family protein
MPLLGRNRWDSQPKSQAAVLLASSGAPFSRAAMRRAKELADGQPVAVLSILKIYGSSFGLPNPGLMPTRRERDEQLKIVKQAINELERRGCAVDGQVAATRSAGRTIAKVARARNVSYIVMDSHPATGIRRLIEGEVENNVRRWLRGAAVLELIGGKP